VSAHDALVLVFGMLTTALAVAFGIPQFLHVRRTGSVAGVSLPSISNTLVSTTVWLLYGLHLHDFWVCLTSFAGIPAMAATLWLVVRRGGSRDGMWIPVAWAALLAAAALLTPSAPALFPAVLGCSILWFITPAAVTAWRSADVSGIAAGTWWLVGAEGAVGGVYGVVAGVPAYVVYAVVAVTGALVVLARLWWRWSPACGSCAPRPGCTCAA
jgi:uncharacterized protein with PQ loop repeat